MDFESHPRANIDSRDRPRGRAAPPRASRASARRLARVRDPSETNDEAIATGRWTPNDLGRVVVASPPRTIARRVRVALVSRAPRKPPPPPSPAGRGTPARPTSSPRPRDANRRRRRVGVGSRLPRLARVWARAIATPRATPRAPPRSLRRRRRWDSRDPPNARLTRARRESSSPGSNPTGKIPRARFRTPLGGPPGVPNTSRRRPPPPRARSRVVPNDTASRVGTRRALCSRCASPPASPWVARTRPRRAPPRASSRDRTATDPSPSPPESPSISAWTSRGRPRRRRREGERRARASTTRRPVARG